MSKSGVAGVLSLVVPGVGQIYNGAFLRGVFWLIVTPGLWLGSGGFLGWVCHLASAYTAYHYAQSRAVSLQLAAHGQRGRGVQSWRPASSGADAATGSLQRQRPTAGHESGLSSRPVGGRRLPRAGVASGYVEHANGEIPPVSAKA
jgi:TM2 domain-containing membrane protein YozV